MAKILVLHGPNLNLLGKREPNLYGSITLADIDSKLAQKGQALNHQIVAFQSNAEHELIGKIQQAITEKIDFIIINPAAYTHTSIALRDALLAVSIPFIEVHLSNVYARESYRRYSYFSDIAKGVMSGFGAFGYELAIEAAHYFLSSDDVCTQ